MTEQKSQGTWYTEFSSRLIHAQAKGTAKVSEVHKEILDNQYRALLTWETYARLRDRARLHWMHSEAGFDPKRAFKRIQSLDYKVPNLLNIPIPVTPEMLVATLGEIESNHPMDIEIVDRCLLVIMGVGACHTKSYNFFTTMYRVTNLLSRREYVLGKPQELGSYGRKALDAYRHRDIRVRNVNICRR